MSSELRQIIIYTRYSQLKDRLVDGVYEVWLNESCKDAPEDAKDRTAPFAEYLPFMSYGIEMVGTAE